MYALLFGKAPFEKEQQPTLYDAIKNEEQTFPSDIEISIKAKLLLNRIFVKDHNIRPNIKEILCDNYYKTDIESSNIIIKNELNQFLDKNNLNLEMMKMLNQKKILHILNYTDKSNIYGV